MGFQSSQQSYLAKETFTYSVHRLSVFSVTILIIAIFVALGTRAGNNYPYSVHKRSMYGSPSFSVTTHSYLDTLCTTSLSAPCRYVCVGEGNASFMEQWSFFM